MLFHRENGVRNGSFELSCFPQAFPVASDCLSHSDAGSKDGEGERKEIWKLMLPSATTDVGVDQISQV